MNISDVKTGNDAKIYFRDHYAEPMSKQDIRIRRREGKNMHMAGTGQLRPATEKTGQ